MRQFNELATKRDLQDLIARFDARMDNLSHRMDMKLDHVFTHLDTQLEIFELRLTLRFGVMLITFIGAAAALIKLT